MLKLDIEDLFTNTDTLAHETHLLIHLVPAITKTYLTHDELKNLQVDFVKGPFEIKFEYAPTFVSFH